MAWTSGQITQNGNETVSYTHSCKTMTTHDAIVVEPVSGGSGLILESVIAYVNPTRYELKVRVDGVDAMAFRFRAEAMN